MRDESLHSRLQAGLRDALKARDAGTVKALRSALAAIANAEAVDASPTAPASRGPFAGAVDGLGSAEATRRALTEADIREIVATEVADRRAAALQYDSLDQRDAAADLREQAQTLENYLERT